MITEPVFELFGATHLVTLALIAAVGLAFPLGARSWPSARVQRVANLMALGLVVYRVGYIPWVAWLYGDPWWKLLPLHICGLLFFLLPYAVWKRDQGAFEISYFWGMGGTLQALLTPEMNKTFPHPAFFSHFVSHAALLILILYAVIAMRMRPGPGSVLRVLGVTAAYAAILLPLNMLLDTNYMYLLAKPASATMLDLLGPWPWYIVAAVGIALVSYVIWYLPFYLVDRARADEPGG